MAISPSSNKVRKNLVFILCPEHSGSTLLGHFLGAHPEILHLGETITPFKKGRRLYCLYCNDALCPVWSEKRIKQLKRYYQSYRLCRFGMPPFHSPREVWSYACSQVSLLAEFVKNSGRLMHPGEFFRDIFAEFEQTRVVVDGSKDTDWARWHKKSDVDNVWWFLLMRDVRAVIASHMRKGYSLKEATAGFKKRQSAILENCSNDPGLHLIVIKYEDLVNYSECVGRGVCQKLNLRYSPKMQNFCSSKQHIIGGHAGPVIHQRRYHGEEIQDLLDTLAPKKQEFYSEGGIGIRQDERWKSELDQSEQKFIAAKTSGIRDKLRQLANRYNVLKG